MKRLATVTLAAAAAACVASAVWATTPGFSTDDPWLPHEEISVPTAVTPGEELSDHLGGVDHIPTKADLDALLGDQAASNLIALARADAAEVNPGTRLRAYRALAYYPGPVTELALTQAISEHSEASAGMDVPYLRVALRSYALIADADAVDIIQDELSHPSKDVRAAAADALALTESATALEFLRARLTVETDPQVARALQDAIRVLDPDQ